MKRMSWVSETLNTVRITILYFICRLLKTELTVESITSPQSVIIQGNLLTLYWKAKGCYKIVINGERCSPGNTDHATINTGTITNSIRVTFHGVQQSVEKVICIKLLKINTKSEAFAFKKKRIKLSGCFSVQAREEISTLSEQSFFVSIKPNLCPIKPSPFHVAIKQISYNKTTKLSIT